MAKPKTLYQKIWDRHRVPAPNTGGALPELVYIDLRLVHEVTSPQAFAALEQRGLAVRRPGQTLATRASLCTPWGTTNRASFM